MYPEEINVLHAAIKNIRSAAASINGKPCVPTPPIKEGDTISLSLEEFNIYLQQHHKHKLSEQNRMRREGAISFVPRFHPIEKHLSGMVIFVTDFPPKPKTPHEL